MSTPNLPDSVDIFSSLTDSASKFLVRSSERSDAFKLLAQGVFRYVRTTAGVPHHGDLQNLLISPDFDDEQVWQQLELDNQLNIDSTIKKVSSLLANGDPQFFGSGSKNTGPEEEERGDDSDGDQTEEREDEEGQLEIESESVDHADQLFQKDQRTLDELEDEEDQDDDDEAFAKEAEKDFGDDEDLDEDEDESGEDDITEPQRPQYAGPSSALDDEFFKLGEMNEFLIEDEKSVNRNTSDTYDFFSPDADDEADYKYEDFFDPPIKNSKDKPQTGAEKSTFEKRQEKLQEKIKTMEEESLSKKPWQLSGEVSAIKRPENSLLEEFLQFDHVMRQPPLITEEVSQKLEDLILQRVKDKAWDDVERKTKPKDLDPYEFKKKLVLDETKSKQSLSQIYEQEYLKKIAKSDKEEEKEEHKKIRKSMNELFVKLDALSNFHFVPKPVAPEIKIINNLPTLVVEEVQPSAMSSAQLLAPEEIQPKQRDELKGKTEASVTDKKRARRKKKLHQKAKAEHQKSKDENTDKDSKKTAKTTGRSSSSSAFFDKLQEAAKIEAFAKTQEGKESKKRKKASGNAKSAKKYKL